MDCSLPGSSVHGIFQARVLEWGAIAFSEINTSSSLENQDLDIDHLLHKLPPNPKPSSQAQLWGEPKLRQILVPQSKKMAL